MTTVKEWFEKHSVVVDDAPLDLLENMKGPILDDPNAFKKLEDLLEVIGNTFEICMVIGDPRAEKLGCSLVKISDEDYGLQLDGPSHEEVDSFTLRPEDDIMIAVNWWLDLMSTDRQEREFLLKSWEKEHGIE